jgi:DNA-binding protein H-NS
LESDIGIALVILGERTTMALKTMSIAKLRDLRARVDEAIGEKIRDRRKSLESELSRLARFEDGAGARGGQRGRVAPKFRNPENPAETWAGRGLRPRWLTAAIKSGKKLEDFAVGTSGRAKDKARG